jgi:hypothetical protein
MVLMTWYVGIFAKGSWWNSYESSRKNAFDVACDVMHTGLSGSEGNFRPEDIERIEIVKAKKYGPPVRRATRSTRRKKKHVRR